MGRTAGWMWLMAAIVGVGAMFLPGAPDEHLTQALVLGAVVGLYGLASILGYPDWGALPLRTHAIATAIGIVVVGYALWLTGGGDTYFVPMLICPLLYISFFYPSRYAWPLALFLVLAGASPLVFDSNALDDGYLPRAVVMAAAFLAVTNIMVRLKARLVGAEELQRQMAERDALTGIANRRAFDSVLEAELTRRPAGEVRRVADDLSVLFFDIDDFKGINDRYGHSEGDRVLREFAAACERAVRPGDLISRIGGDEFAIIAPGAGAAGAARLAQAVTHAAGMVSPGGGAEPMRATVSWALFPHDGRSPTELMRTADRRLHDVKRARRAAAAVA